MKLVVAIATVTSTAVLASKSAMGQPAPKVVAQNSPTAIEKAKCNDIAASEQNLKAAIVQQIRQARAGLKPAGSYDAATAGKDAAGTDQSIDARAEKQAAILSGALFAAIGNSEKAADVAAERAFGDPKRRQSMKFLGRCFGQKGAPTAIIDNQKIFQNEANCASGRESVGSESTQIFVTDVEPREVLSRMLKERLKSHSSGFVTNTTEACSGSRQTCSDPRSYQRANPGAVKLEKDKDIYLQSTMSIHAVIINDRSSDRYVSRLHPIDGVCEGTAYLMTTFGNGHFQGHERSSTAALVARVGGKTLAIVTDARQTWDPSALVLKEAPKRPEMVQNSGFSAYNQIAGALGSKERATQGVVGIDNSVAANARPRVPGAPSPLSR